MTLRTVATSVALAMLPAAANATDVEVHIHKVDSHGGFVRALVCPREQFLKDCDIHARVPAHPGEVVVTVHDVPPGTYAVFGHHDIDGNDDVNQNFLGVPKEGIGFSRNVPLMFGAPRFEDAAISVAGKLVRVDITLKFEP